MFQVLKFLLQCISKAVYLSILVNISEQRGTETLFFSLQTYQTLAVY